MGFRYFPFEYDLNHVVQAYQRAPGRAFEADKTLKVKASASTCEFVFSKRKENKKQKHVSLIIIYQFFFFLVIDYYISVQSPPVRLHGAL